jgi:hypothetical protein
MDREPSPLLLCEKLDVECAPLCVLDLPDSFQAVVHPDEHNDCTARVLVSNFKVVRALGMGELIAFLF